MNKISLLSKVLFFEYLFFLFILHYRDGIQRISLDFFHLKLLLLGIVSVICIGETLSFVGRVARLRHSLNILLPTLYGILFTYHYRAKSSFFFSVFADNIEEAFSLESFKVMAGMFKTGDFYKLGGMFLVFSFLTWKFGKQRARRFSPLGEAMAIATSVLLYSAVVVSGMPVYEEITAFNQSIYQYYFPTRYHTQLYYKLHEESAEREFVFGKNKNKPHIFIIAMESFTDYYMFKKENGKEVTPFINSLAKENFYVKNFYGNSIQTAKGHFAINCSLLPLIKGKAFYLHERVNFKCLPSIMQDVGYRTLFFQGYNDRDFDQTASFALENGYENFYTPSTKGLEKHVWGWGLQDDQSFIQLFDRIDKLLLSGDAPIFSFSSTISHHMRFRSVPKDLRIIYPMSGRDKSQSFINSLHLADAYLKVFFDELNKRKQLHNSIVVLVGDHSYPNGQHGLHHSESGYYEESFRVPLVIVGAGKKQVSGAYSQIDIAPTILELAGISVRAPFAGNSMLSNRDSVVHLVQPYDGVYLSTLKWPYKYVLQLRTGRELLYNLDDDPDETVDIIDRGEGPLELLRDEIGRIFYFNEMIQGNRFVE